MNNTYDITLTTLNKEVNLLGLISEKESDCLSASIAPNGITLKSLEFSVLGLTIKKDINFKLIEIKNGLSSSMTLDSWFNISTSGPKTISITGRIRAYARADLGTFSISLERLGGTELGFDNEGDVINIDISDKVEFKSYQLSIELIK